MSHSGWRTYYGHKVNNCIVLLKTMYERRDDPLYDYQTQALLAQWSGIPQQRISDILKEARGDLSMREINYYSKHCDTAERGIREIIDGFGANTISVLEITARKYGYSFVLNPRPGCLIDVYDHSPGCSTSDFEPE